MRIAVQRHTWGEIGTALGVTKQAAHQKFAKQWAETLKGELKDELRAVKVASAKARPRRPAAAEARLDALIAEFKGANRQAQVGRAGVSR